MIDVAPYFYARASHALDRMRSFFSRLSLGTSHLKENTSNTNQKHECQPDPQGTGAHKTDGGADRAPSDLLPGLNFGKPFPKEESKDEECQKQT